MKRNLLVLIFTFISITQYAQKPQNPNAAELLLKIKKLNFLGSVLYVAAHPDDENTRLIAYYSNEKLANTAYLSLTRGDGGQNLIGPEIREGLGVIRTQELLAARKIDGGKQFFSRANDFGYSKTADETQRIWDREQILADVVWTYRKFRPDVIITRFPPDERAGHGHHTTSAILAGEAFDLAADKNSFPAQLQYFEPWQPKRLFMNTGRWWSPEINENTPGVLTVDVGGYNTLLGTSYTEMASRSRSQHKSQGFGSTGSRGQSFEFLEITKGDRAEADIFEGVETSWRRVKGGENLISQIEELIKNYNPQQPAASLLPLLKVRDAIMVLNDPHWTPIKIAEIDEIIKGMLGLYVETKAIDYAASPGEDIEIAVEVVNRSNAKLILEGIIYDHLSDTTMQLPLAENVAISFKSKLSIPENWEPSQPYWLKEEGSLGTYKVENQLLRGLPENEPAIEVRYAIEVEGHKITFKSPLIYKWNDPVDGEMYRPFIITPPAFLNIDQPVYIFSENVGKSVEITVKANKAALTGNVKLKLPSGWEVSPQNHPLTFSAKGEEQQVVFTVSPPKGQHTGQLEAVFEIDNNSSGSYSYSNQTISYDHFPTQVLMPKAAANLVKIDIQRAGDKVAYIEGAGDAIPASLREIGYQVWEMKNEEITTENLSTVDAVVLGVRALNTNERVPFFMPVLLDYVKNGGTLIIQYNTTFGLQTQEYAPFPLSISRDRVAEEDAKITILNKKHPLLNTPNKITEDDFNDWVQERGLYFPNKWDSNFEPLLASNDSGEPSREGGLLVAKYGKGFYIYTGYSWFRQLPAGVPGAFRIFVNLVSAGKSPGTTKTNNTP